MLNQFFVEKAILDKVCSFEGVCREIRVHVSRRIRSMARDLGKAIPPELLQKMCQIEEKPEKIFECKECGKAFTDGRQLGGHISRAHKKSRMESEQHGETEGISPKNPRSSKTKKILKKSKGIFDGEKQKIVEAREIQSESDSQSEMKDSNALYEDQD